MKWSEVKLPQSCLTLCDPMDCTVHGILQARILEWVAFPSPGDLPNPGIEPWSPSLQVDCLSAEPPGKPILLLSFFFFNGIQLLCTAVSVSAAQQSESAIYISPVLGISFPFGSPQDTEQSSPCYRVDSQLLIAYLVVYMLCLVTQSCLTLWHHGL